MSDAPNRRYEDERMDKLEKKVDGVEKIVTEIKVAIFNGYDTRLKNIEEKTEYIDVRNTKDHERIEKAVDNLGKELRGDFKKLIYTFLGATFLILLSGAVRFFIL